MSNDFFSDSGEESFFDNRAKGHAANPQTRAFKFPGKRLPDGRL